MCQRKGVVGAGGPSLAAPWFRGQRLVPAVVACRLPTAWPDVFVADVNAPLGCVLNLQRCFHSNFVLCFPRRSRSLRWQKPRLTRPESTTGLLPRGPLCCTSSWTTSMPSIPCTSSLWRYCPHELWAMPTAARGSTAASLSYWGSKSSSWASWGYLNSQKKRWSNRKHSADLVLWRSFL